MSREKELKKQFAEMSEEHSAKHWSRIKRTFFVLSGVIYFIALSCGEIAIKTILGFLVVSPIMAGFVMLISYGVLYYIIENDKKENRELAEIRGEWLERKYHMDYEYKNAMEQLEDLKNAKKQLEDLEKFLERIVDEYRDTELNEENEETQEQLEALKSLFDEISFRINYINYIRGENNEKD